AHAGRAGGPAVAAVVAADAAVGPAPAPAAAGVGGGLAAAAAQRRALAAATAHRDGSQGRDGQKESDSNPGDRVHDASAPELRAPRLSPPSRVRDPLRRARLEPRAAGS